MGANGDPPDPGALKSASEAALAENPPRDKSGKQGNTTEEMKVAKSELGGTRADEENQRSVYDEVEDVWETKHSSLSFEAMYEKLLECRTQDAWEQEYHEEGLVQNMFSSVFLQQKKTELPEEKAHYPNLENEEIMQLLRLFDTLVSQHDGTIQQWQRMLRDIAVSVYNSRSTLLDIIQLKESNLKVQRAQTENPWSHNPLLSPTPADTDDPMEEKPSTIVQFKTDVYSSEEIATMRREFETPYDFPTELRAPTEVEERIVQGMLEGTILAQSLPQFLKRTADNTMLRLIQNTIHAQVEGELLFRLPNQFPVYADFQTRERLCNAMLQGAKRRDFDLGELTQMLGETKQVCYNAQQHSVHLIFWTREAANKWARVYKSVPFRSRRFLLTNAHPDDILEDGSVEEQAARVWSRQVGRDGLTNERQHDRYKVKLLNVSRFLDEAGLDAYIRSKFNEEFTTFQEPKWGRQTFQTGAWEIYFKSPACPAFLDGIRFINWVGTKILVHHAGNNPAPPCYNCGRPGHTVAQCRASSDHWKAESSCLTVTATELKLLKKGKSTVTSFEELQHMWKALQERKMENEGAAGAQETQEYSQKERDTAEEKKSTQDEQQGEGSKWFLPKSQGRRGKATKPFVRDYMKTNAENPETNVSENQEDIDLVSEDGSQMESAEEDKASSTEPRNIRRPQALSRQQRLIMEALARRDQQPNWELTSCLQELDIESLDLSTESGQRVIDACGLFPTMTPATGNCQYFAIAMALLSETFRTSEGTAAIESITAKLKKGMVMALSHGYEEEYPHENRKALLQRWVDQAAELTVDESKRMLMEQVEDICSTSSKRTSFLAKTLWGSELTLWLTCKLLKRPIYVIVARDGLQCPSFQVFEPLKRTTAEFEIETAGEFNIEPKEWLKRLQHQCKQPTVTQHLPIVLQYGTQHYSWLKFGQEENVQMEGNVETLPIALSEGSEKKKRSLADMADGLQKCTTGGSISGEIEQNEVASMESLPRNMTEQLEKAINQQGLTTQDRQELQSIIESGGPRKEDQLEISKLGATRLSPAVQKLLIGLDWDDRPQVELMEFMAATKVETLKMWQQNLLDEDMASDASPNNSDVEMDETKRFKQSSRITKENCPQEPDPPDDRPVADYRRRFALHRISTSERRREEHIQREHWNGLAGEWKTFSSLIFPALPADSPVWRNAVKAHPFKLLHSLQTVDSPEFVLRSVNASILQEWTRKIRIDCLHHGLVTLRDLQGDDSSKDQLNETINYLVAERDEMVNDSYIHGRDLWAQLRQYKPERVGLLKLCKRAQAGQLARLIVAAYSYAPELAVMNGQQLPQGRIDGPSLVKRLLHAFKEHGELKKVWYRADPDGNLAAFESTIATLSLNLQGQVETMEE